MLLCGRLLCGSSINGSIEKRALSSKSPCGTAKASTLRCPFSDTLALAITSIHSWIGLGHFFMGTRITHTPWQGDKFSLQLAAFSSIAQIKTICGCILIYGNSIIICCLQDGTFNFSSPITVPSIPNGPAVCLTCTSEAFVFSFATLALRLVGWSLQRHAR